MKIRFLILSAYARGGTVRTTLSNAGALAARGHDVEVASVLQRVPRPPFPVAPDVRLRSLTGVRPDLRTAVRHPGQSAWWASRVALRDTSSRLVPEADSRYQWFSLATDAALLTYLRGVRDGVVVGTRPGLNLTIARHARPGVVTVAQEHMNLTSTAESLQSSYREHYGGLDAVVTLTERDAHDYAALLGAQTRVLAIPNAVPEQPARPATLSPEGRVVVAAGRLTGQKGFDLLVHAWQEVARTHPDWQLHIYGTGVRRPDLERQVAEAGLEGVVSLRGFSTSMPEVLAGASLYVLSSRWEGFPMVLLEAMACGLPVVAYDCPTGPAELIDHGGNGLLVRPRSVKGLTAAIRQALDSHELRTALGAEAARTAQRYSREAIAQRWEELFVELGG